MEYIHFHDNYVGSEISDVDFVYWKCCLVYWVNLVRPEGSGDLELIK